MAVTTGKSGITAPCCSALNVDIHQLAGVHAQRRSFQTSNEIEMLEEAQMNDAETI